MSDFDSFYGAEGVSHEVLMAFWQKPDARKLAKNFTKHSDDPKNRVSDNFPKLRTNFFFLKKSPRPDRFF
jgi:hypothetical protein